MFLKLLRHFKSFPASFSPAFLSLGRKFLPQVFPLSTPVPSGLLNLATPRTSKALSASQHSFASVALLSPPPSRPGTKFLSSPFPGLRAPTLAWLGLPVTNFSQPPAEGPGGQSAAGASWRAAAPGARLCPQLSRRRPGNSASLCASPRAPAPAPAPSLLKRALHPRPQFVT